MVEGAGGAARTGRLPQQGQGAEHVQQVCRDLQGADDGGGQTLARHGQPQAENETDGGDVQVDSIGKNWFLDSRSRSRNSQISIYHREITIKDSQKSVYVVFPIINS
uniref:(northern house mosquito) hypothetical protein n=1 Tax=Culex pipiens TaxID=7175 RepID=A0A8D8FDF5_CULPI